MRRLFHYSPDEERYEALVQVLQVLCACTAPYWIYVLFSYAERDLWTAIVITPVIILVNLTLVLRLSRGDRFLTRVAILALFMKLAAAAMYLIMVFQLWGGAADLPGYVEFGRRTAEAFYTRGTLPILYPFWSTRFIQMMVSVLFITTGPSMTVGMVFFALLSFWGQYYSYRAFCIVVPNANRHLAAVLIFLLPSNLLWQAHISKDSVIGGSLGLVLYGYALLVKGIVPRAYVFLAVGAMGCMLVRPHIGAMIVMSIAAAYLLTGEHEGAVGRVKKMAGIIILVGGTAYFISQAQTFLAVENASQAQVLLNRWSRGTQTGGSGFSAGSSIWQRMAMAPFLVFRPFPWEVRNLQMGLASLEGLFLVGLFWAKRKNLVETLRDIKTNPFMLAIFLYITQFSLIFAAAMSNFGLLARQRVMIVPAMLMLFCTTPASRLQQTFVSAPLQPWRRRSETTATITS